MAAVPGGFPDAVVYAVAEAVTFPSQIQNDHVPHKMVTRGINAGLAVMGLGLLFFSHLLVKAALLVRMAGSELRFKYWVFTMKNVLFSNRKKPLREWTSRVISAAYGLERRFEGCSSVSSRKGRADRPAGSSLTNGYAWHARGLITVLPPLCQSNDLRVCRESPFLVALIFPTFRGYYAWSNH